MHSLLALTWKSLVLKMMGTVLCYTKIQFEKHIRKHANVILRVTQ